MPSSLLLAGSQASAQEPGADTLPADPDDGVGPTFEQYANAWIIRRRRAKKLDWRHHERRLRLHALPSLGRESLRSVTVSRMLAYARSLPGRLRADGSRPLAARSLKNIADSVKAVFADAVDDGFFPTNPCRWNARKHLPAIVDADPLRRVNGFLDLDELETLLTSACVPPLRRVAYALEFLTGLRPGEVAALRVKDVELRVPPAGRLLATRAWSSDNRVEGPTKTRVAKVVPIHPALRAVLEHWLSAGFERAFGRAPEREDLLVPAPRGGHRMASQTNRDFQADLARLGFRKRVHSDARATFRSLVLAARPDLERFADIVTHPSPREAKDLYRRLEPLWPRMAEAVAAIDVAIGGLHPVAPRRKESNVRRGRAGVLGVVSTVLDALGRGRVDLAMRDLRWLERQLEGSGAPFRWRIPGRARRPASRAPACRGADRRSPRRVPTGRDDQALL